MTFSHVIAEEWSTEQKEVITWFKEATQAYVNGNCEGILSYHHLDFTGWDFEHNPPFDKGPFDLPAFSAYMKEDFCKNFKTKLFEIEPLNITIKDNFAIVHVNYKEILKDTGGEEYSLSGRWTVSLIKQQNKWLFLSWSYK